MNQGKPEEVVKNLKFLFIAFSVLALIHGTDSSAQDEIIIPESEDETFIPPASSDTNNPPVILDESDSSEVSDVEEYDG